MMYYPTVTMLRELRRISHTLPLGKDRNYIENALGYNLNSIQDYNRILDLFNKYIAVPATVPAWRHSGENRA